MAIGACEFSPIELCLPGCGVFDVVLPGLRCLDKLHRKPISGILDPRDAN